MGVTMIQYKLLILHLRGLEWRSIAGANADADVDALLSSSPRHLAHANRIPESWTCIRTSWSASPANLRPHLMAPTDQSFQSPFSSWSIHALAHAPATSCYPCPAAALDSPSPRLSTCWHLAPLPPRFRLLAPAVN